MEAGKWNAHCRRGVLRHSGFAGAQWQVFELPAGSDNPGTLFDFDGVNGNRPQADWWSIHTEICSGRPRLAA
jgi:hypothetical protein